MAGAAVKRSAWMLIFNARSFHLTSPRLTTNLSTHSAHMLTNLSSLAAYFFIANRGFCTKLNVPNSEDIDLGRKQESHSEESELTALLKSFEFSDVQIDQIIHKFRRIFCYRVSTNLKPKLHYLVECGFGGSALHNLIVSNPYILQTGLNTFLRPRYEFLKIYLMDKVNMAIKRGSVLLTNRDVETRIEYLKKQGVPVSSISKLLANNPRCLSCSKIQLIKNVEATKAFGIEPSAPMFVRYLLVFGSINKTSWKKKVEVFKSLGWSDEDIRATLLSYPITFTLSEDNIRSTMGFYVNDVKADPRDVIAQPILLEFSLNKRIIPRYEVMKLLKEHNLLKGCKMTAFFKAPEMEFTTKYIEKYLEQVSHLLRVYRDSRKAKSDTPGLNP